MKVLLKIKETVRAFYEKYDKYMDGVARGLYALCVFLVIMQSTGYNATVTNPFIAVGLAVVSAFLPTYVVTIFTAVLLLLEFFSVSVEVAVILFIVFMMVLLLYFVFRAKDSWIMMVTMCACLLNAVPAILPLALLFTPIQTLVSVFGIVLYGFVTVVMKDATSLSSATSKLSMGNRISLLLTDVFTNEKMLLILLTVVATMLLIILIKRSRINDAPFIAIVAGDFLFLVVFLLGNYFLGIPFSVQNYVWLGVGMLLNALLSFILINFVLGRDYKRTEEVQFEDESYYYFVKAVPKTVIPPTERKVRTITGKKEKPEQTKSSEAEGRKKD